jgi:two-component system OmpR family response regulator
MRLLVIEDDPKIASFVAKGLKQSGFAVDHAKDGEEGLQLAETTPLRRRRRERHAPQA